MHFFIKALSKSDQQSYIEAMCKKIENCIVEHRSHDVGLFNKKYRQ